MTKDEQITELKFQLKLAIDALKLAEKAIPNVSFGALAEAIAKKAREVTQ